MTFAEIPYNQSLMAVIGGGCSSATEVLASNLDIPVVSLGQDVGPCHTTLIINLSIHMALAMQCHLYCI